MKKMTTAEAVREAMSFKMREDPTVILLGEDVGPMGGSFGVSLGMHAEFGEDRVRDTPISEGAIVGAAVGAASTGLRPIAELMFGDFLTVGGDQLVNQAAKMRYMFGGKISVPMVLRLPIGAGTTAAAQHSQSLEAWCTHIPGLKVAFPSCAQDAYGLMITAIEDDDPVVFLENKLLYYIPDEVEKFERIPFGKGEIKREGTDVTVIATGKMVRDALAAAETLAAEGVSVEVLDPRTLYPLDKDLIYKSLAKTHKVVIVTEECKRGAYSGEIAAMIAEEAFDYLDAPIVRIGDLNTPVPFSPVLEQLFMPNAQDIVNGVKSLL